MPFKNYENQLASGRRWYARNRKKRRQQIKDRRDQHREWFADYKSTLQCKNCPENDPVCLVFHHMDPTQKDFLVSQMIYLGYGKSRILEEITKCLVLCANCHRKLHGKLKIMPPSPSLSEGA